MSITKNNYLSILFRWANLLAFHPGLTKCTLNGFKALNYLLINPWLKISFVPKLPVCR